MTTAIAYALGNVNHEIPGEILQEAFSPRRYDPSRRMSYRDNQLGVSIDSSIRREVIEGRVLIDINLNSGIETTVALHELRPEVIDPWNVVYRIPQALTGNRNITSVYSISYGQSSVALTGGGASLGRTSPMMEAASGLFMAQTRMPVTSTANVTLIGDNTILVNDVAAISGMLYLRCLLTHEPNLANLKPAYFKTFSELVVLATKAYVYNKLVINLDEGQIKAGSTIGRFREIVDGYADATALYHESLQEKWRKVALLSDVARYRRILQLAVGGRR